MLVPTTADDEMEVTFNHNSKIRHVSELHDGEQVDKGVVQGIYQSMATSAREKCAMTGKAMPSASASSSSGSGQQQPPGNADGQSGDKQGDAAAGAQVVQSEESDDASGDPMDLLLSGGASKGQVGDKKKRPRPSLGGGGCGDAAPAPRSTAKAKAKSKGPANAPPPLVKVKGGVAGPSRSSKAAKYPAGGLLDGGADRAERDANLQLAKLDKANEEFSRLQRGSLVSLDKKYFKGNKAMTDSFGQKVRSLPKTLAKKIDEALQINGCHNRLIETYKNWARKNTGDEFIAEIRDIEKFSAEHPAVTLHFPECVQEVVLQVKFGEDLRSIVAKGDDATVLERFKLISKENLVALFQSEELIEWQTDLGTPNGLGTCL